MDDLPTLTPRQREVLNLVQRAIAQRGLPPTRAEIAATLGFKAACSAEEHLRALQRKGYLLIDGRHRGLRLAAAARALFAANDEPRGLPLIGQVAAGEPILAEQHIEKHLDFDPDLFKPRADFLLRVRGMSMRDAAILDGDLVAVRRTHEARNGQIVVARIGDEATVKHYERRGDLLRLIPANPEFAVIEIDLARNPVAIEGVVVGVVRSFG